MLVTKYIPLYYVTSISICHCIRYPCVPNQQLISSSVRIVGKCVTQRANSDPAGHDLRNANWSRCSLKLTILFNIFYSCSLVFFNYSLSSYVFRWVMKVIFRNCIYETIYCVTHVCMYICVSLWKHCNLKLVGFKCFIDFPIASRKYHH